MIHLTATKDQVLLGPTTAATTTRSASFDFMGADYATIRVIQSASAGTNGGLGAISVLHADSVPTQATQFATFSADLGTQITTSHEIVYHIDCRTLKRYGKIIITPNTNTNDSIISVALLTLGRLEAAPSATSDMVNTTNDVVRLVT